MQTFVVTQYGPQAGLPLTATPFPHVAVGEAGRGRLLARVPVDGFEAKVLDRVAVTRDGWLVPEPPEHAEDRRALVLVDIPAGGFARITPPDGQFLCRRGNICAGWLERQYPAFLFY